MHIAYVCADPGVPVFGAKGASVHVQEMLRTFLRRGDQVALVCVRPGGSAPEGLGGVSLHAAADDAGVAAALSGLGPVDLVYERYSLAGRAGMAHAAQHGVPGVLEVNSPLIDEQQRHRTLTDRSGAEQVLREAVGHASSVVCVSQPVADWVAALAPAPNVLVAPNGVDVTRVRPATTTPPGPFTVGFVGTFKPWHGVDTLLEAVAMTPQVRALLVGDGPTRGRCELRAAAPDLAGRVAFLGARTPAEIPSLLHRLHVGVAPAAPDAGGYFSPLKVLEYLAAGLPVVASRTEPVEALVTDGHDALLVPAGHVPSLAAALARLRDDPALRARLGAAARRTALGRTWDAVLARVLEHVAGARPLEGVAAGG
jgi:glycosyltransferase involved in cell wall biosynthesis